MKVVLQRVSEASVTVGEQITGAIGLGLLALVGIAHGDDDFTLSTMATKVTNLRIFEDDDGKMNRSLMDVRGAVLAVSQFTLFADTRKGRRPVSSARRRRRTRRCCLTGSSINFGPRAPRCKPAFFRP